MSRWQVRQGTVGQVREYLFHLGVVTASACSGMNGESVNTA